MAAYEELRKEVNSKETFLRFLDALRADWDDSQEKERVAPSTHYGPLANDWENPTLGQFLDAMHTWAFTESTLTDRLNVPEKLSWQILARWLSAAKIYE